MQENERAVKRCLPIVSPSPSPRPGSNCLAALCREVGYWESATKPSQLKNFCMARPRSTKFPCTSELKCPYLSLSWSRHVSAKLSKTGQWICCHNGSESVAQRSRTLEQPTGQASQQSAWVRSALLFRTTLFSESSASYLDGLILYNAVQIFTCCTCLNFLCFALICVTPSVAVRDIWTIEIPAPRRAARATLPCQAQWPGGALGNRAYFKKAAWNYILLSKL